MSKTFRAVEATRPGVLNLVQRPLTEPAPGQVRIRVEACGVCHSDAATVEGMFDSSAGDPAAALQKLGGAKVILITASGGKTVSTTFKGLRPGGISLVLGVGPEPNELSTLDLVFGSRKLEGALTGDPATGDATLRFSALSGISAMIETIPLERAPDGYAKMMAGKARFRIVLTM